MSNRSSKGRDWGKLLLIAYYIKLLQFLLCFYLIISYFWVFISILESRTCLKPCLIFHDWPFPSNWRLVNVVSKSQYVLFFMFLKLDIKFDDLLNRVTLVSGKLYKWFKVVTHKMNDIVSWFDWTLFLLPINVVLFHVFFWWQRCIF